MDSPSPREQIILLARDIIITADSTDERRDNLMPIAEILHGVLILLQRAIRQKTACSSSTNDEIVTITLPDADSISNIITGPSGHVDVDIQLEEECEYN